MENRNEMQNIILEVLFVLIVFSYMCQINMVW